MPFRIHTARKYHQYFYEYAYNYTNCFVTSKQCLTSQTLFPRSMAKVPRAEWLQPERSCNNKYVSRRLPHIVFFAILLSDYTATS